MLVLFEIITQNYKPFFITKNLDEFLSVPHLKQSLLLDTIKKYGIHVSKITKVVHKITNIKGISSANWKYFINIDINKLLPLNNILINELNPQEQKSYDKIFKHQNCPIKCLKELLADNCISMDIAIVKYVKSAHKSELLHLLQDILHSKLSVDEIIENPRLVVDLLVKEDGNLTETFLQTVRNSTKEIIIL